MIKISNDEWGTPFDLYTKLDKEFLFGIDVCANDKNALSVFHMTKEIDALNIDWSKQLYYKKPICWMNPPYSRNLIWRFVKKAYEESQKGCTVVGLVKFDPSTSWFKEWIWGKAHEIRMCYKRVKFINPETGKAEGSPNFPSIIVVWKPGKPEKTEVSMYYW